MVTAILPSLTDDTDGDNSSFGARRKANRNARLSAVFSVESEITITPERYTRTSSNDGDASASVDPVEAPRKPSALAGYVGMFTGCGALVALVVFLPLPASFGRLKGVTQAQAVAYSFYVVGTIALFVSAFVFVGLRNLKGEEGKGWGLLLGRRGSYLEIGDVDDDMRVPQKRRIPYVHLMKDSVLLAFTDSRIGLGYLGGFVARASTVAISLFIPLFINTYFIDNGFCHGSPHDPSPELKKECRAAYILSSILTGVAQLFGLLCAPLFGYLSGRKGRVNYPIVVATTFGILGYTILPQLASPEIKNVDGRGGSPAIFVLVILIGISQIGSIVCSLGSLGQGVLAVDLPRSFHREASLAPDEDESTEDEPLIRIAADENRVSRVRLKGSIAGVYSLCGGAAILLLTKLGGYLFDNLSTGAPFYMMAGFNAVLLIVSLWMDAAHTFARM